jgi:hypothetical protein
LERFEKHKIKLNNKFNNKNKKQCHILNENYRDQEEIAVEVKTKLLLQHYQHAQIVLRQPYITAYAENVVTTEVSLQ